MPHSHGNTSPINPLLLVSRHDGSARIDECGLGEQVLEEGEEPPNRGTSSSNEANNQHHLYIDKDNTSVNNNITENNNNNNTTNNNNDSIVNDVILVDCTATASDSSLPSLVISPTKYVNRNVNRKTKHQTLKFRLRSHLTTDQSSNSSSSSNSPKQIGSDDDEDHLNRINLITAIADAEEESAISSHSPSPPSSPSSASLADVSNHPDPIHRISLSKRSLSRSRSADNVNEPVISVDPVPLVISTHRLEDHSRLSSATPGSSSSGNASDNEVSSDDGGTLTPPPNHSHPKSSSYLNFTAISFNDFKPLSPTATPDDAAFPDGYDPSAPCEDLPPAGQSVSWVSPSLEARTSHTGSGVFAVKPIKAGEHLIVWTGRILSAEQALPIMNTSDKHYILQIGEGFYQTPLQQYREPADWTNHSCNPNAGFGKKSPIALSAMKDIAVGEEVTFDYGMCETDERLWEPMRCMCETAQCRGWITVNDYKIEELWSRYDGFFAPHVQKLVDQLKKEKAAEREAAAKQNEKEQAIVQDEQTSQVNTLLAHSSVTAVSNNKILDTEATLPSVTPVENNTIQPVNWFDRTLLRFGVVRRKLLLENGIKIQTKIKKKAEWN